MFYLTHDEKFIVRRITQTQKNRILKSLPSFLEHLKKNQETCMINVIYGLFEVSGSKLPKTAAIIYRNLSCCLNKQNQISLNFELNGHTSGRKTMHYENLLNRDFLLNMGQVVLKDDDLENLLRLYP